MSLDRTIQAPNLTGARTYREIARPSSPGRWHVLADGHTVVYERTPGTFETSIIQLPSTLSDTNTWEEITTQD